MARRVTRRGFIRDVGVGAVALTIGPGVKRSHAQGRKTLKLLQWSHFVPSYDKWFDKHCEAWGKKHNVQVIVDHISLSDLKSTFAAEVVAGKGHDLVEFISPPSDFEPSVHDLSDVHQEALRRFGTQIPVSTESSYNPHTKKFYGFCHGWTIDPGDYRKSLWTKVGKPDGPRTWEELLTYGAKIKKELGVQAGIGLSQELDSNMAGRALLWSYGAGIQDEHENVVLDSKKTIEAVKYMTDLYRETLTPEVFSWNPASNNQLLIAGRASYILNSISAYRTAQTTSPSVADDIFFVPALKGPGGKGLASQHVVRSYMVPKWASNVDKAKQFLLDLVGVAHSAVYNSELYDFPAFPNTGAASALPGWLQNDPFGSKPASKLALLATAQQWTTNVGYPGAANAAIGEIFTTNVLPTMMASAAQGKASPKAAVASAASQCEAIFTKWRAKGLV